MMQGFWNKLRNYLIVGLIAILPFWISYFILYAVFNITASLAKPFVKFIPGLANAPFWLNVVSFLGTLIIVIGVGVLLTNVVGRRVFKTVEQALHRIPILSWIYQAVQKLTSLFYGEGGNRYQRVVMLEYPRRGIFVLGFMTTESVQMLNDKARQTLINVFLPTTPNPTSGFLLMVPKEDVILLDMSTEEAVKLIVSGGVAAPEAVA